ncbi:Protein PRY2 [Cyphellophora attinorum]|uniref:Protein PRY2 n=1 Tax=Cyphellophora attinorum TaxID=1664694 RepID=A0A0N0NS80_9EURO|nr:Protein PRY2 [Phialophora attinorum]KPI45948.1 Protein PRY2 [Phialophora attinorum]
MQGRHRRQNVCAVAATRSRHRSNLLLLQLLLFTTPQPALAQDVSTSIVTETISLPASSTVTQTFTAPVASSTSSDLSDTYTDPTLFHNTLLNTTNFYRYLHSAPFLTYNTSLATFAQSYSTKCIWAHNPELGSLNYGENLARGYANLTAGIDAWYNEVTEFDYDFDKDDPTGFTEATGHFTQLVWRDTVSVGCGWTDCGGENGVDGVIVVCDYYPAGNVLMNGGADGGKALFVSNVLPERSGGAEGWQAVEADAIKGVRNETGDASGGGDEQGNNAVSRRTGLGIVMVGAFVVSAVAAWGL